MFILGVNTGPHDGSATLLHDGQIVVMVEQERLSRRKRAFNESPAEAVRACLDSVGISLADVTEVAVGWDTPELANAESKQFDRERFSRWLFPSRLFGDTRRPPLRFVRHHIAHSASALWSSGKDQAAALVVDGRGESDATTIALGSSSEITVLRSWDTLRSLGHLYGFAAEWAGLSVWGAGKLMGLAAYGDPTQPIPLAPTEDGYEVSHGPAPHGGAPIHYFQLRNHLRRAFKECNYPFAPGNAEEPMAYADFAASVQKALEDSVFSLVEVTKALTGVDALTIAGGVGMNCTLNGKIARSGAVSELHVPPVPHDSGVSLGAALYAHRRLRGRNTVPNQRLEHAYLGLSHSDHEIETALKSAGLRYERLSEREMASRVSGYLTEGRIIGWWQGRSEVGERALGNRSILCDPRERRNLTRLNELKGREVWRPLAPSVLEERFTELFAEPAPAPSAFMLCACPVREDAKRIIPAAVHVDGSARPQAVSRATNPRFWSVIEAFRARTGVPAVINTSFNQAGEPNVYGPDDAVATFRRCRLDVLAIGDFLVENSESDQARAPSPTTAQNQKIDFFPWDD